MSGRSNASLTSLDVCTWLGGEWVSTIDQSFDNVPIAMMTLYEMTTTEGWTSVMYAMVDSRGLHMQPIRDNNPWWALMLNLFVAVVIDNFNRANHKNADGTSDLLTPQQEEWVKLNTMMLKARPGTQDQRPWIFVCYPCWWLVVRAVF